MNYAGSAPLRANYSELFGNPEKFSAVSADESQAAEIGRSILQNGGNATDAAVAMYFAMAVTLPSAAGLGASGACIVHDAKTRAAEAFVFDAVAAPGPIKGVSVSVPSAVRAMTLMQIRHGQARWEMDVAPGEKIATFGTPVSRALARDLKSGAGLLDGEAARIFMRNGVPLAEGDRLVQSDLAVTLGAVRREGGIDFFSGGFARTLSERVALLGGNLPPEALRNTIPRTGTPPSERDGGYRVYVAPPPMAGASALDGWNGKAAPAPSNVSTDSGGFSGLAAIDEQGNAAACAMSMGQLFGSRIMVPGTGMLLGTPTADSKSVSPLVIGNPNNGEVKFAGAGGGSAAVSYATGLIARATVEQRIPVKGALSAPGAHSGYVNAIACPDGIKSGGATCQTGIDPASAGLALVATDR